MRILIPVDESDHSRRVLDFISNRESLLGTKPEIELANVQHSVPEGIMQLFGMEAAWQQSLDAGKAVFNRFDPERLRALGVTERVLSGNIGRALAEEAAVFRADLIIMGTRGLNPMKGLLLGSVSNDLLAHTRVPVLLIRENTPPLPENLRVGIFVDGSAYGAAAADLVIKNRALFGKDASFTVLHAAEPMPYPIAPTLLGQITPTLSPDEVNGEQKRFFEEAVKPVVDAFAADGTEIRTEFLVGHPDVVLSDYANKNLDLIVMGSHGYGNFTAAVLGSTAMHIAAKTVAPILVVRKP